MSYYPILNAPNCHGWTTLCNFPPNNWEVNDRRDKLINVTWSDGNTWQTRKIGELSYGAVRTMHIDDVKDYVPEDVMPLLSMTRENLPLQSDVLPLNKPETIMPAWRAALGISTEHVQTSYQGEIDPFPSPGSLLTFCPFMQFAHDISNYLIFTNLEKSPVSREVIIEIYNANKPEKLLQTFEVKNNSATVIKLDGFEFNSEDLPLIVCKGMSGIPLYLTMLNDGTYLSLEHTHPPASYVIHGNRWGAQKIIKDRWFSMISKT